MEQIKKHNYKDPLHQKGDPFGATEAKVAHVNDVITEVNNIDTRVTALENAPAHETTEYFINGAILHYPTGDLVVTVDSHNTPVRNIDLSGVGADTFENVFYFGYAGNSTGIGIYSFGVQNSMVVADLGSGEQSCEITNATISSIIINPDPQISVAFAASAKPYVSTAVVPYLNTDIVANSFIADLSVFSLGIAQDPATKTITSYGITALEIPSPTVTRRIFNFQLKFSEFVVVPV
jgi:hypothetical protein